jgi:hypothetical protein
MGFFTGSRKLSTSRIQTQRIMKNEKIPIVDEKHDINFHWPKVCQNTTYSHKPWLPISMPKTGMYGHAHES